MSDLKDHFNKSQPYLKLGDQETFIGLYISWEAVNLSYKGKVKKGYRFNLEREDGNRITWDTSNSSVIDQIGSLLDKGMKKGDLIRIYREGIEKENTKYKITRGDQPFSQADPDEGPLPF